MFGNAHYWHALAVMSIALAPAVLHKVFTGNADCISRVYDIMFSFIVEPETFANLLFLIVQVAGFFRFYFLAFPLLDLVSLSQRLINVIKSVTHNVTDLMLVFTLMLFVAYIFSMMGLFLFGQNYAENADDYSAELRGADGSWLNGTVSPGGSELTCFNLLSCFTVTIDYGLRSGDIVDAAMDSSYFTYGQRHVDRVIFGLLFFFVLGVILFDIVTGIIIDTFGALREATAERISYLGNTAFISELERGDYEELGPGFKLEKLENEEQPIRNYMCVGTSCAASMGAAY